MKRTISIFSMLALSFISMQCAEAQPKTIINFVNNDIKEIVVTIAPYQYSPEIQPSCNAVTLKPKETKAITFDTTSKCILVSFCDHSTNISIRKSVDNDGSISTITYKETSPDSFDIVAS